MRKRVWMFGMLLLFASAWCFGQEPVVETELEPSVDAGVEPMVPAEPAVIEAPTAFPAHAVPADAEEETVPVAEPEPTEARVIEPEALSEQARQAEDKVSATARMMAERAVRTETAPGEAAAPEAATDTEPRTEWGAFYDFLRSLAVLCAILCAIILGGYAWRKLGKGTPFFAGPSLGRVLGKVYLDRNASLCFVRVADRVLVTGVTQNSVSLLTELDADAFDAPTVEEVRNTAAPDSHEADFSSALREQTEAMAGDGPDDEEIVSLRNDIQRLRRYLQEAANEPGE